MGWEGSCNGNTGLGLATAKSFTPFRAMFRNRMISTVSTRWCER
jgi:hypothetical protein